MKTATCPSLLVEPQLRADAESVQRETIARRRTQDEFVARGLCAGHGKRVFTTLPKRSTASFSSGWMQGAGRCWMNRGF